MASLGIFINLFHGCGTCNFLDPVILLLIYGSIFLSILNCNLQFFLWITPWGFVLISNTFHRLDIIHNGLNLKYLNLDHIFINHRRALLILWHLRLPIHLRLDIPPSQLRLPLLLRIQLRNQLTKQLCVLVNHHTLWVLLSMKPYFWAILIW